MRKQKVLHRPAAGQLHGFYDYLVNQVNRLSQDPTASIKPPKQDKSYPNT